MFRLTFVCDWCSKEVELAPLAAIPFMGRRIRYCEYDPFCSEHCESASAMAQKIVANRQEFLLKELRGKTLGELKCYGPDGTRSK